MIAKKFVSSIAGQLIKINYVIRIDIKHRTDATPKEAMTRVDFPVKMLGKLGMQIPVHSDANEGQYGKSQDPEWNP